MATIAEKCICRLSHTRAPLTPAARSGSSIISQLKEMIPLMKYVGPLLAVYFGAYLINQGVSGQLLQIRAVPLVWADRW
jgi:hypothetical protein